MQKNLITILAGVLAVLATPFISIPSSWKEPFFIVIALTIAVISYREKHAKRKSPLFTRRAKKTPVPSIFTAPLEQVATESGDEVSLKKFGEEELNK